MQYSLSTQHDGRWFNSLPSIETADLEMRQAGCLELACEAIGPIIVRHNLHKAWGVGLLHNHWRVAETEVPIQQVSHDEEGWKLVMSPRTPPNSGVVPSILGAAQVGLVPLEYSDDQVVKLAYDQLQADPDFVAEICAAFHRHVLNTTFGLVALRPYIGETDELIEFNYQDRTSVVRRVNKGVYGGKNLIQTAWSFSPHSVNMACQAQCFSRCVDSGDGNHVHQDHVSLPHIQN